MNDRKKKIKKYLTQLRWNITKYENTVNSSMDIESLKLRLMEIELNPENTPENKIRREKDKINAITDIAEVKGRLYAFVKTSRETIDTVEEAIDNMNSEEELKAAEVFLSSLVENVEKLMKATDDLAQLIEEIPNVIENEVYNTSKVIRELAETELDFDVFETMTQTYLEDMVYKILEKRV